MEDDGSEEKRGTGEELRQKKGKSDIKVCNYKKKQSFYY